MTVLPTKVASVSHIVRSLMKPCSSQRPTAPRMVARVTVSSGEISPRAVARQRVRAILASMVRSTRQFSAAAAKETSAMPSDATRKRSSGGKPGVARNMPIMAVNTIRLLTRGLHRWLKALKRWIKLRDGALATVCMAILLAVPGVFEQAFEVGAHALGAGIGGVSDDQLALRINEQHGIREGLEFAVRVGQQQEIGLAVPQGEQGWVIGLIGQYGPADAAHVLVERDVDAAHLVELGQAGVGAGAADPEQKNPFLAIFCRRP